MLIAMARPLLGGLATEFGAASPLTPALSPDGGEGAASNATDMPAGDGRERNLRSHQKPPRILNRSMSPSTSANSSPPTSAELHKPSHPSPRPSPPPGERESQR